MVLHAFQRREVGTGSLCGIARMPQTEPDPEGAHRCLSCLRSWKKRYP